MSNIANSLSNNKEIMKKSFQTKQENSKLERLKNLKDYVDSKENDRMYTKKYMYRRDKNKYESNKSEIVIDYEYIESDYPALSKNEDETSSCKIHDNKIDYNKLKSSFNTSPVVNKKVKSHTSLKQLVDKPINLNPFNTELNKFEKKSNIIFDNSETLVYENSIDTEWKVVSKKKKSTTQNKWY